MSREIKFRAWHDDGFWLYLDLAALVTNQVERQGYSPIRVTNWCQYTGLKDKNGVEIYESDILKGFNYEDEPYEVKLFPDGSFEYSVDEWGHSGDDFEVIGNIYENPELLQSA